MRSIVVLKLCCLGDLVFLTPALHALRLRYPEAHITLVAANWAAAMAPSIPDIDNVLVTSDNIVSRSPSAFPRLLALALRLRRLHPDLVFTAHRNSAFGLLAWLSGARIRAGFEPLPFLTHGVAFDPEEHEVDRYLRITSALACETQDREPRLLPAPSQDKSAAQLFEKLGLTESLPLVCLAPGGGENPGTRMTIKRWEPERYATLARALVDRGDCTVVLTGSPAESELCASILHLAQPHPNLLSLAGSITIMDYVALAHRGALVIGGDTGPLHIAAALGTPVIMLFGPSDPRLVAPRDPRHRILWTAPECSPCYTPLTVMNKSNFQGRDFPCRVGSLTCMREITVKTVLTQAAEILDSLSPSDVKV